LKPLHFDLHFSHLVSGRNNRVIVSLPAERDNESVSLVSARDRH
jgi:hypothetical protein